MKFVYQYRTRENEVRSGVVAAQSRDAAFAALKAQGIRPSRLDEAPGFFNKLLGKGKRWLVIGALAVLCAGLVVALAKRPAALESAPGLDSSTRRQLIGDTGVIERGVKTGWKDVFPDAGEQYLASFAIPGVPGGVQNADVAQLEKALALDSSPQPEDPLETRQIKAIVEGMKAEIRAYLAAGGNLTGYEQRLVERQDEELAYYNRAKNQLDKIVAAGATEEQVEALWETLNAELRQMGIKLLPLPE